MGTRNELNNICRMPICTVCVSSSTKAFWSTSMTLIEAAKQALEHIEYTASMGTSMSRDTCHYLMDESRKEAANLRAAIEETEKQEPVAEVYRHGKDSHGREWHGIHWYDPNLDVPTGTKLYTHPAPAVPPVNWLAEGTPPKYTPGKSSPPSSSIPEGWQPIETAPKGGTDFLATEDGCIYLACHAKRELCWYSDGKHYPYDYFTHWMPLPAAPKFGEKE